MAGDLIWPRFLLMHYLAYVICEPPRIFQAYRFQKLCRNGFIVRIESDINTSVINPQITVWPPKPTCKHKSSALPHQPGVYKYFDDEGIIYVGKAIDLRKRVSSYFTKQDHNKKTQQLVKNIKRIEFTIVDCESDAFLLENNLIKQHQPKYNILLKDGKTYPYLCLTNERFPRLIPTRNKINDGSRYYGPYANGTALNVLLELIRALYPLRTCTYNLTPAKRGGRQVQGLPGVSPWQLQRPLRRPCRTRKPTTATSSKSATS